VIVVFINLMVGLEATSYVLTGLLRWEEMLLPGLLPYCHSQLKALAVDSESPIWLTPNLGCMLT